MSGTLEIPVEKNIRQQMQDEFESLTRTSFANCMDALNKVDFYQLVLRRLEQGTSIEDDVPEVKDHSPEHVKQVVLNLISMATVAAKDAWLLSSRYAGAFETTIRSNLPEGELIPQYDVEHVGQTDAGIVKVKIKSWRRNLEVVIVGSNKAIEQQWMSMSMAAMRA